MLHVTRRLKLFILAGLLVCSGVGVWHTLGHHEAAQVHASGGGWGGPEYLPAPPQVGINSVPSAVSWAPGRLDVFARSGTNTLLHWWYDASLPGWGGPETIGQSIGSAPSAVSWAPGRLDVFAMTLDYGLFHWWFDNGPHSSEVLNGHLYSTPSAVSWGIGRLDVFGVSEVDPPHHPGHWWYDTTGWHVENMAFVGGDFNGKLTAISRGPTLLDVFGQNTFGTLQHWWFDGASWHTERRDESVQPGLSAVPQGTSRFDVFGVSSNVTSTWLSHWWYDDASGWHAESLGGSPYGSRDVSATSWAPGRIDVFAQTTSNQLQHWLFDEASGWHVEFLPSGISNSPNVVSWALGRLDVFGGQSDGITSPQHWWYPA